MTDEKDALLEVLKAIEELREKRGITNKQIFKFARKRLGKPEESIKVEKTTRTLNKLVDEGVLVKKGRRYMLPNFKEKKYAVGDRNPNLEIKSESEEDESEKEWLTSDDEGPGTSKKKKVLTKKGGKLKNKNHDKKRNQKKPKPSSDDLTSETERGDRSRSPIVNKNSNTDNNKDEPESDKTGDEQQSKSQISVTSEGLNVENSKVEDFRYESSNIPTISNPQVVNVSRKNSCCIVNCTNQESDVVREDQILNKMKHERDTYRKHLRRSPSKAKERQHKKKERDELIEKGRIEKFNRQSYSPEGDGTSFCCSCDDKEV